MKPSEEIKEKATRMTCYNMYRAERYAEPTISNYISAILDYLDETLNDDFFKKIREIKKKEANDGR